MRTLRLLAAGLLSMLALPLLAASGPAPVAPRASFSQPAISPDGTEIAFVSGGAIWEVPVKGGAAHLLIADKGADWRPLFAPDGKHLAFVSDATGGGDVYVLDLATGQLTRVTYADGLDELSGWSPDGQWVYFNSARDNIGGMTGVYRVRITGGTPMPVSLEDYRFEQQGVPSPDDQTIALVGGGWGDTQWWRHGSAHIDHGAIWLLRNDGSHSYTRLTPDDARADWPMWAPDGQSLYYMSDRSGTENLWHVRRNGSEAPLTHFTDGRMLWPTISGNGQTIAFGRDFGIWTVATATGKAQAVPIALAGAIAGPEDKHEIKRDDFHDLALSPDGKKVALVVHGQVYAADAAKGGRAEQVTHVPGIAYGVTWAPDSQRIVYGAFRDGGEHLYAYDFRAAKETQLTHGSGEDTAPAFLPDGKSLGFLRDGRTLELMQVATHRVRALATAQLDFHRPLNSERPLAWSPDGRWIAVLERGQRMFRNVVAVNVASGKTVAVSGLGNTFADDVVFSPDGRQLLFTTGQRTEQGKIASVDLVPQTPRFHEDQFLQLFKESTPAERPGSESARAGAAAGKSRAKPRKPANVRIDADGILNRLTLLPTGLNAQAITLSPDGKTLVVTARVAGHANLYAWSLDPLAKQPVVARQLTSSGGDKNDVQFSPDGKTVYYLDAGKVFMVPLAKGGKAKPLAINAAVDVNFTTDKLLAFEQAWTWLRDNYHNPAMNGVDWNAVRAEYLPLIAGAPTPASVNRLMNLLVGELDSSHSGVRAGDKRKPVTGRLGLLFDPAAYAASGKLRVAKVTPLSPAAVAGVKAGDVLEAVDGHALDAQADLFALLAHRVGHKTTLRIASAAGTRNVEVKPVDSRTLAMLNYNAWVTANRAYVARISDGKLGYIDLPDLSEASLARMYRQLDAYNMTRDGVVIDVRNNYGGFVNAYALDVLSRKPYLNMTFRGFDHAVPARSVLGQRALERPTVLITNRITLSDGEDFTEGYEEMHLGKVVGEPTAGWIIYTSDNKMIDGATVRLPFITVTTEDGKPMELHPRPVDVPVTRPLGESYRGRDSDLDAAVKTLLPQLGQ
ncbi:MAG: PDZ domain-containing protein [Rhodanobacteraceae bacterium]|nr:MAG: PDZ domain-containing protein [Rhodanobacteraceae bacterium]